MISHNNYTPERLSIAQQFSIEEQPVCFDVRLEDLNTPDGKSVQPSDSESGQIRFSLLVHNQEKVLAAAEPYRLGPDRKVRYLTGDDLRQLTALLPGLPIVPQLTEAKESDEALYQRLMDAAANAGETGWTHSLRMLTPEQTAFLQYRRLTKQDYRNSWDEFCLDIDDPNLFDRSVPNTLGFLLGITEGYAPDPP